MDGVRSKIMIVDDNITNLTVGRNLLKTYYDIYLAPSAAQMFEMLEKVRPDLILLDIEMPGMDGYAAIAKLKADVCLADVPVIFLTAQNDEASELKGFDLGAVDYINKPFSPPLLLKRIEHQILFARQRETIQYHVDNLSVMVSEKVSEAIALQNALISTMADLVEFRDQSTGGHITRTQLYLKAVIDGLRESKLYTDEISGWNMDFVMQSAQLHDVGKIAIPDAILNKPDRLTAEEYEIMKTHVVVGVDAVKRIISKTKSHAFLDHALNIVGCHHEKWDGTGYPYKLKGLEIPLEGRIMAIADVYDALVSWRPYKEEYTHERAKDIIREGRGTYFDPVLVDVFLGADSLFENITLKKAWGAQMKFGVMTLSPDMEIGVPYIDAQHKELLDRLNKAVSMGTKGASRKEAQEMLDFLGEYVVRHFGDEEALQKQIGYPKYEWHRNQHQFFIGEYQKLNKEFTDNGFSEKFMLGLNKSLIKWVVQHIKSVDVEFGKYYQIRTALREESGHCQTV